MTVINLFSRYFVAKIVVSNFKLIEGLVNNAVGPKFQGRIWYLTYDNQDA